jgi:3-(3-hydroxy-phenyl)propionate hydroxylase
LIAATAPTPSQRDEVTRRGAVVVMAHPGTELALWLQSGRARVALVRPDRTVMCAGRDIGEILGRVPVFAPPDVDDV